MKLASTRFKTAMNVIPRPNAIALPELGRNLAYQKTTRRYSVKMPTSNKLCHRRHSLETSSCFDIASSQLIKAKSMIEKLNSRFVVKLAIMSNYGNPSEISMSEVDILDEDSHLIPVVKVLTNSSDFIECSDFQRLTNSELIKDNVDDEWNATWSKPGVSLSFVIDAPNPPSYIRIWNSKGDYEKNVKDVQVFLGDRFVNQATIPQKFGITISLVGSDKDDLISTSEDNMLKREKIEERVDRFGEIPAKPLSSMQIHVIDSYKNDSGYVSLNAIELFDFEGNKLECGDQIKKITVLDADMISSSPHLFGNGNREIDLHNIWVARAKLGKHPIIDVEFEHPVLISLIRIWNCDSDAYNFGAKKLRILSDKDTLWYGRIKISHNIMTEPDKCRTSIWLTDSLQITKCIA